MDLAAALIAAALGAVGCRLVWGSWIPGALGLAAAAGWMGWRLAAGWWSRRDPSGPL